MPAYARREKACKGTAFFRYDQTFLPKNHHFTSFFIIKIKIAKLALQNHSSFPYFSTSNIPLSFHPKDTLSL